ncbi:reverse transcriptase domain-containing protein [Artemisia annua]|uniref:Reverse transcriptase domain-containing protein n=1 Tax=Artemisia annua TaxID=35608 RepID=A0A2U1PL61_ARTAN|nr:reverse transcriptase domain-containing protein [Artemisia annua]
MSKQPSGIISISTSALRKKVRKVETRKGQTKPILNEATREPNRNHDLQLLMDLNEKAHQKKVPLNKSKGKQACLGSEENQRHPEPDMFKKKKSSKQKRRKKQSEDTSKIPNSGDKSLDAPRKRKLENVTICGKSESEIHSELRSDGMFACLHPYDPTQQTYCRTKKEAERSNHGIRFTGVKPNSRKSDKVSSESARTNGGCVTQWPVCRKVDLFNSNLRNARLSERLYVPDHVKRFDGSTDSMNHLKVFQAIARVQHWDTPTQHHMFKSTLYGPARIWFNSIPPESVNNYQELQAAFLQAFPEHERTTKNGAELRNHKQRKGESVREYVRRF